MKKYLRFIPMVCIMGIIFYLSHQPGDALRLPLFPGIDKLAHFIAYGFLAGAFLYSLQPYFDTFDNKFIPAVIVVVFCVLFGISDEYHQTFIPGRFASLWDLMADGFGALFVVVWWLFKVRRETSRDYL